MPQSGVNSPNVWSFTTESEKYTDLQQTKIISDVPNTWLG